MCTRRSWTSNAAPYATSFGSTGSFLTMKRYSASRCTSIRKITALRRQYLWRLRRRRKTVVPANLSPRRNPEPPVCPRCLAPSVSGATSGAGGIGAGGSSSSSADSTGAPRASETPPETVEKLGQLSRYGAFSGRIVFGSNGSSKL